MMEAIKQDLTEEQFQLVGKHVQRSWGWNELGTHWRISDEERGGCAWCRVSPSEGLGGGS